MIEMKKAIFFCLLLGMTTLSCRNEFEVEPSLVSVDALLGTWKMTRYQDLETNVDVNQPSDPLLGELRITFNADGMGGGRINCNSMGFEYRLERSQLTIINAITTNINCDESWVGNFFKLYDNPTNAPFVRVSGATLTLTSENQKRKVTMIR
jgi:heat shock protein HslJ